MGEAGGLGASSVRPRLATADDAPAIAAIYRPVVEATAISFEIRAPDDDEMRGRILETLATHPWLVLERDGRVAGFAYASRHRARPAYQWSVDTSVYVADEYRRLGLGRDLYVTLFAILVAQGFVNAYAGIALPNPASVAFHERLGFESVGIYRNVGYKLDAWRDVGWWQRPLAMAPGVPSPPESIQRVAQRADWTAILAGAAKAP
jgi:L-amino acid N-acyltransferase YncA